MGAFQVIQKHTWIMRSLQTHAANTFALFQEEKKTRQFTYQQYCSKSRSASNTNHSL
jgi:hypothetical protein